MKKVLTGFHLVNPRGVVVDLVTINPVELLNLRVVPVIETLGDESKSTPMKAVGNLSVENPAPPNPGDEVVGG